MSNFEEQINGIVDGFSVVQSYDKPVSETLAELEKSNPELVNAIPEIRERIFDKIIKHIKEHRPGLDLFQINMPDDNLYVARRCSWGEFKRIAQKPKKENKENQAIEDMVTNFLIYPKPKYEFIDDMLPGTLTKLSNSITKALGFSAGTSVKNL